MGFFFRKTIQELNKHLNNHVYIQVFCWLLFYRFIEIIYASNNYIARFNEPIESQIFLTQKCIEINFFYVKGHQMFTLVIESSFKILLSYFLLETFCYITIMSNLTKMPIDENYYLQLSWLYIVKFNVPWFSCKILYWILFEKVFFDRKYLKSKCWFVCFLNIVIWYAIIL